MSGVGEGRCLATFIITVTTCSNWNTIIRLFSIHAIQTSHTSFAESCSLLTELSEVQMADDVNNTRTYRDFLSLHISLCYPQLSSLGRCLISCTTPIGQQGSSSREVPTTLGLLELLRPGSAWLHLPADMSSSISRYGNLDTRLFPSNQ